MSGPAEVYFTTAEGGSTIVTDFYLRDGWLAVKEHQGDGMTYYPSHLVHHIVSRPNGAPVASEAGEDSDGPETVLPSDREPEDESAGRLTKALSSIGFNVAEAEYRDGKVYFQLGPPAQSDAPEGAFGEYIQNHGSVDFDSDTGKNSIEVAALPGYIEDVMG